MTARKSACSAEKFRWKNRSAIKLINGSLELVALLGGGAIASFRFAERGPNLLWESPWTTMDPDNFRAAKDSSTYGPNGAGKFLSGYTGHAIALGCFGSPSRNEAAAGLAMHGEVGARAWRVVKSAGGTTAALLIMESNSQTFGLHFRREIELRKGESYARISETVTNERKHQTFFQWMQLATFGEPLLSPKVSVLSIPGFRAETSPLGYEGAELLAKGQQFRWPMAPSARGGTCDLSRSFHLDGKGYLASVLLDPTRDNGFIAAYNPELRVVAGYSFPRKSFPWVSLWEENRARNNAPWNGVTRAVGAYFGTSPLPVGLAETIFEGPVFNAPTLMALDAESSVTVSYFLFAAEVPPSWEAVGDLKLDGKEFVVRGTHRSEVVRL